MLAPRIGQCPAKNRITSNKNYFTTDTVVWYEVKKKSYRRLTDVFMNILIDDLLIQFFCIQNRKMCLSKKILYQYFAVFFFFVFVFAL